MFRSFLASFRPPLDLSETVVCIKSVPALLYCRVLVSASLDFLMHSVIEEAETAGPKLNNSTSHIHMMLRHVPTLESSCLEPNVEALAKIDLLSTANAVHTLERDGLHISLTR